MVYCLRYFASFLIVIILFLQVRAFVPQSAGFAFRLIDYPMYTDSLGLGPIEARRVRIFAVSDKGILHDVNSRLYRKLGLGPQMFLHQFCSKQAEADKSAA